VHLQLLSPCWIKWFAPLAPMALTTAVPPGYVTFERRSVTERPRWRKSTKQFSGLKAHSQGTIEDDGTFMLQVDFANRVIGGGVLGHGCVQEEIRFLICPGSLAGR
jgi:poly(ADP-ribose) glycohydrolase